MRKLERFLSKYEAVESVSTYSKYYQIESCKIRVSDHFSKDTDADLQIIIPLNESDKYIVTSSEASTTYLWGTNTIIDFIKHLVPFCNLKAKNIKKPNTDLKINKIRSKFVTASGLSKEVGNVIRHSNSEMWNNGEFPTLLYLINQELQLDVKSLPDKFKDFLITTPCSYVKALNLYKIAYVDNSIVEEFSTFIRILNS